MLCRQLMITSFDPGLPGVTALATAPLADERLLKRWSGGSSTTACGGDQRRRGGAEVRASDWPVAIGPAMAAGFRLLANIDCMRSKARCW